MGPFTALRRLLRKALGRDAPAGRGLQAAGAAAPPEDPPPTAEQSYERAVDAWVALSVRAARRPRWLGRGPDVPPPPVAPQRHVTVTLSAPSGSTTRYEEPSVRVYNNITPETLRTAILFAESGNLSRAADICEQMLGDDRIAAVFNTRANALLGCDVTFEAGRGRKKKAALKALEAGEDYWSAFPEDELSRLLIWGRLLGIGLAEIIWEDRDPGSLTSRRIPRIKVWHPRFLRYDWQERAWFLTIDTIGGAGGTEIRIEPGKGKWIFYTPYGRTRPWAYGLWRGLSRLWLVKQYALDDWALHGEVHGQPIRMGFMPPEAMKIADDTRRHKLRAELAADIAAFGRETSFVPPPGFDFKLVEAVARTWEMFQAQIEMADVGFSVAAIGTSLPTDVKPGVGTGATASTLVRQDYLEADAETLTTTLHDQALIFWAELNFATDGSSVMSRSDARRLAPWPVYGVEPPADLKAMAERINIVANALRVFTENRAPLDVRKFLEGFEVPLLPVGTPVYKPFNAYHLDHGVPTRNEVRESLGYDRVTGGDVRTIPAAQLVPGPPVLSLNAGEDAKTRARSKVGHGVRTGQIPDPNELPCSDCGHTGSDMRHEYDHHRGYHGAAALDVVPVCSACHKKRSLRTNGSAHV